mmetsp:Transcript_18603/g.52617  ORF Transcript_18603/g.52617 Transcript_18603/m.52617 type:complete len:508 (+) Transcript_18603:843-2366(+)
MLLIVVGGDRRPAPQHGVLSRLSQVPDHHGAIVAAGRDHVGMRRGEMQRGHAVRSSDHTLGIGGIFQRPEEDEPALGVRHGGRVAVRDCEQILVASIPLRASDGHVLRQLGRVEAKQILQGRLVLVGLLSAPLLQRPLLVRLLGVLGDARRTLEGDRGGTGGGGRCLEGRLGVARLAQLVQLGQLLQRGIVPVDHVLLVEHVLRDDALHHAKLLQQLARDGTVRTRLPRDRVHRRRLGSGALLRVGGHWWRLVLLALRLGRRGRGPAPFRHRGQPGRAAVQRGGRGPAAQLLGGGGGARDVPGHHARDSPGRAPLPRALGVVLLLGGLLPRVAGRVRLGHGEEAARLLDRLRHGQRRLSVAGLLDEYVLGHGVRGEGVIYVPSIGVHLDALLRRGRSEYLLALMCVVERLGVLLPVLIALRLRGAQLLVGLVAGGHGGGLGIVQRDAQRWEEQQCVSVCLAEGNVDVALHLLLGQPRRLCLAQPFVRRLPRGRRWFLATCAAGARGG